ncbi:MAG: DNA (cytosine-5-)-methyltransferase [Candidatus Riflebacteria bacterium]|nr:DNA (cytosine-5-)-methyltransferase [Candidatus Riflebacteria bacterium]
MRSVELFSGCGGLAMGLSRAGFRHDLMVEWNDDAVMTVLRNKTNGVFHVRDWPILKADVRDIDWKSFLGSLALVAGGPPCQPFSIGGKHKGYNDARDMWPPAILAVRKSKPNAFLFENVQGLTRKAFSDYLAWIVSSLSRPSIQRKEGESYFDHLNRLRRSKSKIEYKVIVAKVNAADFGAPQKRHRVIVAGIRNDLVGELAAPTPTHSRERLLWDQWVSGDYWRKHGMARPDDLMISRPDRALVKRLRKSEKCPPDMPWVTVRDALSGLGSPTGHSNHTLQAGARAYQGHTGSPMDMPAKALKAGDHGVPGGENMMIQDEGAVRYFTIREAARLQGLPDDYTFPGSWTESMRQLGNAVPVQLGEAIGIWMASTLRQTAVDMNRRAA